MEGYITVAQYAKAKGITKQAVYQQLNKQLKGFVKEIDGKKMLSINVLAEKERNRLKQADNQDLNNNFQDLNKDGQAQNDITRDLIDMLREELAEKNRQIDSLTAALAKSQEALATAQALHAGTLNALQPPKNEEPTAEAPEDEQPPENPPEAVETAQTGKKSVWDRLFRKSK